MNRLLSIVIVCAVAVPCLAREITGTVVTPKHEVVAFANVTAVLANGRKFQTDTTRDGRFELSIPNGPVTILVGGRFLSSEPLQLSDTAKATNLLIEVSYRIAPVHESLIISADAPDPAVEDKDATVFNKTLFGRDDQIFHVLDAGIDAGQHEGGGKSVEVRRFGFNLDHGGVSGGLKVLVDDVQQNQSTQGHGQGYLGQLKSLSPELVQEVQIVNGPFRAEYGDFSGLGVVHIRTRESLPDVYSLNVQGGSFNSERVFAAFSPAMSNGDALLAYEGSRTDGPFQNPLRYMRNNVTASLTRKLNQHRSLGFKLNTGTNTFDSSGQLPLDLVENGSLDRFGFVDPSDGGRVRSGTAALYLRQEMASGDVLKIDGFAARSLFDLWSNFTFFLNDPVQGDEIQQHDSRLQEGVNAQYIHVHKLFGQQALLTAGGNFHDNQINVGLFATEHRDVLGITTSSFARVTNAAVYAQEGVTFWRGRLHAELGMRLDTFRFSITDKILPSLSGVRSSTLPQPKINLAYTPVERLPLTLYFNFGRGISSQDARGVVTHPDGPQVSTTDFFQWGLSHHAGRFSSTADLFLIDRSNEQVYVPDDGSIELKGPSRSYGWEAKTSVHVTDRLIFNAGVTAVSNSFYRGTSPRIYVDSAPHVVGNGSFALADWKGFSGSLRYRYGNHYRLTGDSPAIIASGFGVLDFSMSKRLRRGVDLSLAVDNLTNKSFYETQNYFASRVSPASSVISRIHGTPGYPAAVTVGMRFYFAGK